MFGFIYSEITKLRAIFKQWSQIKLALTISAICTLPANLIIARALDAFKEFSLAWSRIVYISVYDNIGRCTQFQ